MDVLGMKVKKGNVKNDGTQNKKLLREKKYSKRKRETKEKRKTSDFRKNIRKFNGNPKISKPIDNKKLAAGRLKPRRTQEGIYLKGIRTSYIKRISLSETNEARKNEDINKIIDIGGATARKALQEYRKCHKSKGADKVPESGKCTFIFRENDLTSEKFEDIDKCTLSPISFFGSSNDDNVFVNLEDNKTETFETSNGIDALERFFKSKLAIDYNEEFKRFSLAYEKKVATRLLLRLPKKGVLKSALESLRHLRKKQESRFPLSFELHKAPFLSGYELLKQNSEAQKQYEVRHAEKKSKTTSFSPRVRFEDFSPNGLDFNRLEQAIVPFLDAEQNCLLFPELEAVNERHDSGVIMQDHFVTPQIQFFRRNMF